MPIYIDDLRLAHLGDEAVAAAVRSIWFDVRARRVTPALALRLIKRYLRPLCHEEHLGAFEVRGYTNWDSIAMIPIDLAGRAHPYLDARTLASIRALQLIYSHTKMPHRIQEFSSLLEVTYFRQMCEQLGRHVSAPPKIRNDRSLGPFRFCRLCWRHPLCHRDLCPHHTPSASLTCEVDKRNSVARYKSGVRQKKLLDDTINRLLTKEALDYYRGYDREVLLPDEEVARWLAERRPFVWGLVGDMQAEFTDESAVPILLDVLHSPVGLPPGAFESCCRVNEHFFKHPADIWPMLVRAEAWMKSRHEIRSRWGGKRIGAGRPSGALSTTEASLGVAQI